MKIVFNTDQIYLHGGIEKVMALKASYFANLEDFEVYIVTTEQKAHPPCYAMDPKVKLIDLGIDYNRSASYFSTENLRKSIKHFNLQKNLFKKLKPDIIISPNHNFDHYWLPFISGKSKILKEWHGSRFAEELQREKSVLKTKIKFYFTDFLNSLYDRIVVLNEDEKCYVKSGNGVVIPNPTEITTLRADLIKKRVIAAGRISPVKAFDQLIQIFAQVHPDFSDWELHIYGQDYLDTQEKLQKLINAYQLTNVVYFMGSVDNLTETMADYSIYGMTSETECFPMVLLEALSVGMPVISYDCPNGPRNILTSGEDSFLIPDKNLTIFAKQLKILMKNEDLRTEMGARGLQNVQRFSVEIVMTRWQNLFAELLR